MRHPAVLTLRPYEASERRNLVGPRGGGCRMRLGDGLGRGVGWFLLA
jgi:hypothetical protein